VTRDDDRRRRYSLFWLLAGLTFLVLGIAVFSADRHGHRIGGFLVLLAIACLAISLGVGYEGRRSD